MSTLGVAHKIHSPLGSRVYTYFCEYILAKVSAFSKSECILRSMHSPSRIASIHSQSASIHSQSNGARLAIQRYHSPAGIAARDPGLQAREPGLQAREPARTAIPAREYTRDTLTFCDPTNRGLHQDCSRLAIENSHAYGVGVHG